MKAFISHRTALHYWRTQFPPDAAFEYCTAPDDLTECAHKVRHVLTHVPESCRVAGRPVDVLVFDPRQRGRSNLVTYHLWQNPPTRRAFHRAQDMCVSTPEFVFLQMASELSTIQLIALGCELCGLYAAIPRQAAQARPGERMRTRTVPLTSIHRLEEFASCASGSYGRRRALRALKYLAESLRSPLETAALLQLCLPPALGGYGIARPQVGVRIELEPITADLAARRWFESDLCWPDALVELEYNGIVRAGARRMRDDAHVLALEYRGWIVVTLSAAQVHDIERFEMVALRIAKRLGHRMRRSTLGRTPARRELHEQLASWMEG